MAFSFHSVLGLRPGNAFQTKSMNHRKRFMIILLKKYLYLVLRFVDKYSVSLGK